MFGSVLGYVMLRILGEGPDDGEDMTMGSGRRWILDHGGATGIPSWGKFWLTVLGVHEWEGCNPMPPEFWLLPKISPIHPGKLLCYCRLVYMPMSYLYGKRFVGPITGLVQSLRNELYIEPYDRTNWNRARNTCAKEDLYYPHPLVEDALWGFLHYVGEPVLTCWPFSVLRKKALNVAMKHIHYEDESNRYLCIGCVEKVLCLIACWVEDPNSDAYKLHLERIPDYFWLAEDGMKIQSFGSQSWDAALSIQAITSSNLSHEYGPTLHKAHDFIKASQAVLLLSQMSPELVGEKIEKHCQCDAVNLILSLQSTNRGFPAWEPQRAFCWLEYFNPVEFLEDVLIEREYVECTASAIQALLQFKKLNPEHRRKEIESSIARGIKYIEDTQNDDGSWYGFCGICFTYGTWFAVKGLTACRKPYYNFPELRKACAFLLSKQLPDGGWGESHFSSSKKVYTNLEEGKRSNLVQTSWALLSLTAAGQTEIDPEPVHRGMRLLINSQMEDGVSLSRFDHRLRSTAIRGPIELKFYGHVQDSLVFILNGGDRIWSSRQPCFNK